MNTPQQRDRIKSEFILLNELKGQKRHENEMERKWMNIYKQKNTDKRRNAYPEGSFARYNLSTMLLKIGYSY